MKKVLDKALERKIAGIIENKELALKVVEFLVGLQDASGLKICQVITKGDPTVVEVK